MVTKSKSPKVKTSSMALLAAQAALTSLLACAPLHRHQARQIQRLAKHQAASRLVR